MNTSNNDSNNKKRRLLFWLAVTLLVCLWVGWGDFNPYVAQEVVREDIRATIRGVFQIAIQYVAPIGILVFMLGRATSGSKNNTRTS